MYLNKSFLLVLLIGISTTLVQAQETKPSMQALDEALKNFEQEVKRLSERLEKSRRRRKNIAIALHTLQTSFGLLLLYISYYVYKHDAEFAALEAQTGQNLRPVTAIGGLVTTAAGLWNLYHDLDLSDQIKKIMKLIKTKEKEREQ